MNVRRSGGMFRVVAGMVVVVLVMMGASVRLRMRGSGARPVLRVQGGSLRWSRVSGVSRYVGWRWCLIRLGHATVLGLVRGTSLTRGPVSGQTIGYRVRVDRRGALWSREVSISYPSVLAVGGGKAPSVVAPVSSVSGGRISWVSQARASTFVGAISTDARGSAIARRRM